MAWFGDNFKSLTDSLSGQIQTAASSAAVFTREVLAEGTEETSDHETELKISEDKVRRLELAIHTLQAENERLRELNQEYGEKAETSELQINTISSQYRAVVQEKEEEIKRLKQSQNEFQSLQPSLISPTLASSTSTSSLTSSMVRIPGEDLDLDDVISAQQEINRLSNEVSRLQSECSHWKEMVRHQQPEAKFEIGGDTIVSNNAIHLSARIKELEKELQRHIDESQNELTALQNAHSQKLTSLKKNHTAKEEEFQNHIRELENELRSRRLQNKPDSSFQELSFEGEGGNWLPSPVHSHDLKEELNRTKEEMSDLEKAKNDLEADLQKLKLKERQQSKLVSDMKEKITRISKEKLTLVEEIRILKDRNRDLKSELDVISSKHKLEEERMSQLSNDKEEEITRLQDVNEQVRGELLATKHRLLNALDDSFNNTSAMLQEVQSARKMYSSESNSQKVQLFLEKQRLVEQLIDLGQQMSHGKLSVASLEEEREKLSSETEQMINKMGVSSPETSPQDRSRLSEENLLLRENISQLEQEVSVLKDALATETIKTAKPQRTHSPEDDASSVGSNNTNSEAGSEVEAERLRPKVFGEMSEGVSFDGEYDDSLIFASLKERYPEAANLLKDQMQQMELIKNDWEMEKQALEEAVIKMRDQIKEKERELDDAKNMSSSSSSDISELEQKVNDLKSQLTAVESAHDETEQKLAIAIKDKELFEEESAKLRSKAEKLVVKMKQTLKERDSLKEQFEESQHNLSQLQDELSSTRQELDAKTTSVSDMSRDNERLNSELQELDMQHEQALQQVLQSKDNLSKSVADLKKEAAELHSNLEGAENKIKMLEESNGHLEEELNQVKAEQSNVELERQKLEGVKIAALQSQITDLENSRSMVQEKEVSASKRCEDLEIKLKEVEQRLQNQRETNLLQSSSPDTTPENNDEDMAALRKALQEENTKRSELEVSLAKLQHEKISLREDTGRKANEITFLKEELSEKERILGKQEALLSQVQTAKDLLEGEVEELQKRLKEESEKHEQSLLELTESKDITSGLLNEEQAKHKTDLKDKERLISELTSRCEEMEFDLSGTKDILNTTLENQTQLTELLKEKENDIKHLAKENEFFMKELEKEKKKVENMEKDRMQLEEVKEAVNQLQEEKEALVSRLNEFEAVEQSEPHGTNGRTLGLITDLEQEIATLKDAKSQKDLMIKELESRIEGFEREVTGNSENQVLKEREYQATLHEKEETYNKYQAESEVKIAELTENLRQLAESGKQEKDRLSDVESTLKDKENELAAVIETKGDLENELQEKSNEVVLLKKLVAEKEGLVLAWREKEEELQGEVDIYDESLKAMQEKTSSYQKRISDLEQELHSKEEMIYRLNSEHEDMNKTLAEKTSKVNQLQGGVEDVDANVQSQSLELKTSKNAVNRTPTTDEAKNNRVINGKSNIPQVQSRAEFTDPEPLAISDSEKQLEKMIQERDRDLTAAQVEIETLLKKLEEKSKNSMGNTILVDLHKLQMQKKNFESERHQMVTILNEKTRECSNLKNEVHKLMKIVSAEKMALEKAQEDNRELQKALQTPRQDMQKEAVQNLSRIIQDKDLEISALKQKNDSLLEVLQASSPNQSSDISKILQENEQYQKENRVLREERDQLVVSIHQKHHESVSYYEEVQRLAGVLTTESEKAIKLQKVNESLTADMEVKDQSLNNLKTQLEEKSQLFEESKQECETQRQSLADLELQFVDLNESFSNLERRNKELESLGKDASGGVVVSEEDDVVLRKDEEIERLKAELTLLKSNPVPVVQEPLIEASVSASVEATVPSTAIREPVMSVSKEELQQIERLRARLTHRDKELQLKESEISQLKDDLEKRRSEMADRDERINQKTNEALQKQSEIVALRQQIDIQNQGLLERDALLQQKTNDLKSVQDTAANREKTILSLKNNLLTVTPKLQNLQADIDSLRKENHKLQQTIMSKDAETRSLQDMSNRLVMQVKEKDFEMEALREKNQTLTSIVHEREMGTQGEVERMLRETEAMQRQAQMFQHERDQAVLALQSSQSEMEELHSQVQVSREKEVKLNKELDRLRTHLIQIEETYSTEALQAEDREKVLRDKLAHYENSLRDSSTAVQTANIEASKQIENLLDQISTLSNDKEELLLQLSACQEQSNQYATSLFNLQSVLEQFQREKDFSISQEIEIYQKRAQEKEKIAEHLFKQNMEIQNKLSDTQDALESARRLADQLDKKEEDIHRLKVEIGKRDSELDEYRKRFEEVSNAAESKVDKPLVKNLLINYFHAPDGKKNEVMHLISSVLNFSEDDLQKVGLGSSQGGWLSGLFGRRPSSSPAATPRKNTLEQSFTQQFVHFLEIESTPKPNIRLPIEEMTKERPKSPAFNPFSAPLPSQSPFIPSSPPANKSLPTSASSLFNPVPVASTVRPTSQFVTPSPFIGGSTPSPLLGAAAPTLAPVTLPVAGSGGRNSPAAKGESKEVIK